MDRTDAKNYLYRAWNLDREIDALERLKRSTYDALTGTTPKPDATPGGSPDPHKFDRYAALAELIDRRVDELADLRAELLREIARVGNSRYRTLLLDRYVRFMRWEDIATEMHYAVRHVTRLHIEALDAFAAKMS